MPLTPHIAHYEPQPGVALAVRRFAAVGPPRVQVVGVHGIISHSGWYDACSEYLAQHGMEVHFLDRRGAGLNAQGRGDVDRWQTWVDDIVAYAAPLKRQGPVVLLGISWGGKIAPAVARQRPDLLAGMALVCPGIYAWQQPGLVKRCAMRVTKWLGMNERQVTIPLADPTLFTDAPLWREYIRHDPLTLRTVSLRFAREDYALNRYVRKSPPWVHTPTLMMLSGRDRILKNKRMRQYFADLASRDKTLLEYPVAAHTFEFEPDPEPIFSDLVQWIRRCVSR